MDGAIIPAYVVVDSSTGTVFPADNDGVLFTEESARQSAAAWNATRPLYFPSGGSLVAVSAYVVCALLPYGLAAPAQLVGGGDDGEPVS